MKSNMHVIDAPLWARISPPYFWEQAQLHVVGDRHLDDGTRQHLVLEEVQPGLVINNAQVFSEKEFPQAEYGENLSWQTNSEAHG